MSGIANNRVNHSTPPPFNVPSCVLFSKYALLMGSIKEPLPVQEWHGQLPERDLSWMRAAGHLGFRKKEAKVIFLGQRAAFSTAEGSAAPTKSSGYAKVFRNGATLYPRNLFFVSVSEMDDPPDLGKSYWAVTDEIQAKESKKPYDEVRLSGLVEGRFIFTTALSRNVLPFAVLEPMTIVLPVMENSGVLSMASAEKIKKEGFREFGEWMYQAEAIWDKYRQAKQTHSLQEWLDYSSKLTNQDFKHRHLVLYNAAGTNVSAAYFDRNTSARFYR